MTTATGLFMNAKELEIQFSEFLKDNLNLDLTRGKPCPEQLDLSNGLDGILNGNYQLEDGGDARNYGGLLGIPEARRLGSLILGIDPAQVMAAGNSSLTLMFNYVSSMMSVWNRERENNKSAIKFLCPVPGYDRHFTICEHLGIEMVPVKFLDTGPDMAEIEALVDADPMIKGIWCVPKYSNPTGHTYAAETVARFARLASHAGRDFRIFWDNAYALHDLTKPGSQLENLMTLANACDNQDSVIMIASTSKMTFAGAGMAFLGCSRSNLQDFEAYLGSQTIGYDKVNQLRHVRFFQGSNSLQKHMDQHREIIAPKFALVEQKLSQLAGLNIISWTQPMGGYFVSVDTHPGLARQTIDLAAQAGVKLTPAGSTFPLRSDPEDKNIRIAPTFPDMIELEKALDVLVCCLQLALARSQN